MIWGLKNVYHTHRHIHKAFYENAKKLGYKTLWLEDVKSNQRFIKPNDLIISAEVSGKMVKEKKSIDDYHLPLRDDVWYCLHNYQDIFKKLISKERVLNLAVYRSNEIESDFLKIDPCRFFDSKTKTLYQPWGTDLLKEEFKRPIFNKNKFVFWIGSIWNNSRNEGNIEAIDDLKNSLKKFNLKFIRLRFIPDFLNIFFIRRSRIAPAIAGNYQVEVNYLPCRVFKNISYGQLGITNVGKFKEILLDTYIEGQNIEEIIKNSLSLDKEDYINKVKKQQKFIENYTYKESIENIIKYLNIN